MYTHVQYIHTDTHTHNTQFNSHTIQKMREGRTNVVQEVFIHVRQPLEVVIIQAPNSQLLGRAVHGGTKISVERVEQEVGECERTLFLGFDLHFTLRYRWHRAPKRLPASTCHKCVSVWCVSHELEFYAPCVCIISVQSTPHTAHHPHTPTLSHSRTLALSHSHTLSEKWFTIELKKSCNFILLLMCFEVTVSKGTSLTPKTGREKSSSSSSSSLCLLLLLRFDLSLRLSKPVCVRCGVYNAYYLFIHLNI